MTGRTHSVLGSSEPLSHSCPELSESHPQQSRALVHTGEHRLHQLLGIICQNGHRRLNHLPRRRPAGGNITQSGQGQGDWRGEGRLVVLSQLLGVQLTEPLLCVDGVDDWRDSGVEIGQSHDLRERERERERGGDENEMSNRNICSLERGYP